MNRPFLKVLKFRVIFSFFFPLVIFRIHTRSRQLVAHAKSGSCTHQRALTFGPSLRLNKLPNFMRYGDVLRAHFGFRYAETMNVVSCQGIGKNFYLSIINGESFLCSLIAYY